jgi:hypothetical protein
MVFIVNSLSMKIIAHILGLDMATKVWEVISNMFATPSRARINHLRGGDQ